MPTYRKFINPSSELLAKTVTSQTIAESENEVDADDVNLNVNNSTGMFILQINFMYRMSN